MFRPNFTALKALSTSKPFWVGETACTERHGDKANWIKWLFSTLRTTMAVDCLTWFDHRLAFPGEYVRDWQIDSSPESLAAFQRGIQGHRGVYQG